MTWLRSFIILHQKHISCCRLAGSCLAAGIMQQSREVEWWQVLPGSPQGQDNLLFYRCSPFISSLQPTSDLCTEITIMSLWAAELSMTVRFDLDKKKEINLSLTLSHRFDNISYLASAASALPSPLCTDCWRQLYCTFIPPRWKKVRHRRDMGGSKWPHQYYSFRGSDKASTCV